MKPKTVTVLYWICTVLFAGFMIFTAVPSVSPKGEALQFMHDYLGYPVYFITFLSIAKIIGSITILIPGLNKIKEWAYAGLFFDLVGAVYSIVSVAKKVDASMSFILLGALLGAASYYLWNKRKAA